MLRHVVGLALACLLAPTTAFADPGTPRAGNPAQGSPPHPVPRSADTLASALRGQVLGSLPDPLFQGSHNWDRTVQAANGIHWHGKGIHIHAETVYASKNHGTWQSVCLTAVNPNETLTLDIREMRAPNPGRLTFKVFVSLDARAVYDQQNWQSGVRLYSGTMRARFRLHLVLDVEVTARLEPSATLLPEAVLRFQVKDSHVGYDNLVVEHLGGVGGTAARMLGEAVHAGLRRWHPSLERDLLARAEASIIRAGGSRQVHLGLSSLLNRPSLQIPPPNVVR